jgi:hypothetical protein
MASDDYVCSEHRMPLRFIAAFCLLPEVRSSKYVRDAKKYALARLYRRHPGSGIGCFLLFIAVFMSVLVANKHTALRVNDVAAVLLLYGLGAVFLIGGISLATGGGRWFIRSLVSFGRRGGSGRI